MSIYSRCQNCGQSRNEYWNVTQAELNIGTLRNWKAQLCSTCTTVVEGAIVTALKAAREAVTPEPK